MGDGKASSDASTDMIYLGSICVKGMYVLCTSRILDIRTIVLMTLCSNRTCTLDQNKI